MKPAWALVALGALSGCDFATTGVSARYIESAEELTVRMPAGAPSIQQQFSQGHHLGIDILGNTGDPVLAAASGVVLASYRDAAYGERVTIDHGQTRFGVPLRSLYMHLETRQVAVGDRVRRGDRVGTLGMTGALAIILPHLHFEVHAPRPWGSFAAIDPHRTWIGGAGRVTCLSTANRAAPSFDGLTYPVACKPGLSPSGR